MRFAMRLKGAVGFSTGNSWTSRLIRWFTRSQYSHAFIVVTDGKGKDEPPLVMEATRRGVVVGPITKYTANWSERRVTLFMPKTDRINIHAAVDKMWSYVGIRYGFLALAGLALRLLLQRLGIRIGNPIGIGMICSECQFLFLRQLPELSDLKNWDRDEVTPEDLFRYVTTDKSCQFDPVDVKLVNL